MSAAPVIAGLAVGVGVIVVFAVFMNDAAGLLKHPNAISHLDRSIQNSIRYDQQRVPNIVLVTPDGERYMGEEGSYCAFDFCVDTAKIIPDTIVTLRYGSNIEFQFLNSSMPREIFPSAHPYSILENDRREIVNLPRQDGNLGHFITDLPKGDYMLTVGANWKDDGQNSNIDSASYFFTIRII